MVPISNLPIPVNRPASATITVAAGQTLIPLTSTTFNIFRAGEDPANSTWATRYIWLYNESNTSLDTDVRWGGADGANFPIPAGGPIQILPVSDLSLVYLANPGADAATVAVGIFSQD